MKHITYGDKSLLVGDLAADTLLEYAATLAQAKTGDTVTVSAISSDGDEVSATFLLGPGTTMMAESANNHQPEPDNEAVIARMKEAMRALGPVAAALEDDDEAQDDVDYNSALGIGG